MNARRYVEDGLVRVLLWTGLAEDEAEAREIAAETIVEDPNLYRDRALRVELEAVDPEKGDRYRTHIWLEGDPGEISEYSGEATFQEGVLTFDLQAGDGTTMTFAGTPLAIQLFRAPFRPRPGRWSRTRSLVPGN